jgi:precorrin-6Y C5,15-methyltransferase (decarboxylating)
VAPFLPPAYRRVAFRGETAALLALAREVAEPVVVLASGDPLFFGIAGALRAAAPEACVRVLPWFNSLQTLCHRIGIAYERMVSVSVHGRGWEELDAALIGGAPLIGVLTDATRTPAAVAARLLEYGFTQYVLHVGEALESAEERVTRLDAEAATRAGFHALNCMVLQATTVKRRRFGIAEDSIAGLPGRPDMVTKMPVRLTSLAQLDLPGRRCLWDIGTCTGSVAIEARLLFPHLAVVAFERRAEGTLLLQQNARALGAPGIVTVDGDFLAQDLAALPPPDAAFIGGHGGRLAEMLRRLDAVLAPGGRIVINTVRDSSAAMFVAAAADLGWTLAPPVRLQVDAHNPITVLGATRP